MKADLGLRLLHLADRLGLNKVCNVLKKGRITVLMYHGVIPDNCSIDAWTLVKESEFLRQIEYISREYEAIPADQLVARSSVRSPKSRKEKVIITFDDGYRNNYLIAYPILKKFNVPALIFLPTHFIGRKELLWFDKVIYAIQSSGCNAIDLRKVGIGFIKLNGDDPASRWDKIEALLTKMKSLELQEREVVIQEITQVLKPDYSCADMFSFLEWSEIKEMVNSGLLSFGSHGHRHQILTQLPYEEVFEEIFTSAKILKKDIGVEPIFFSYPNGELNPQIVKVLKRAGFRYAFTTKEGSWEQDLDNYSIPRINIGGYDSMALFRAYLSGLSELL